MRVRINKAYFLIPLLYITVIVFLLYLQFSGSHYINAEVSGITIEGQTKAGAPGKKESIPELTITYMGVAFCFSEDNPFLIYSQDGLIHKAKSTGYRVTASGIDVYLSKGITCSFTKDEITANKLIISINTEDPASIRKLQLPLINKNSSLKADRAISAVSINTESNGSFCLTIPDGGVFHENNNSIEIVPGKDGISRLIFEQNSGYGIDAFSFWKNKETNLLTDETIEDEIAGFIKTAQEALLTERLDTSNGTWTAKTENPLFYEDALIMAATETIGTSSFNNYERIFDRAASLHGDKLNLMSSCLFGNIVNEGWSFDDKIGKDLVSFTKRAQDSDFSVFSETTLIPILLTENSQPLRRLLIEMSKTTDEVTDFDTAIDILYFYSSLYEKKSDMAKDFSNVSSLIDSIIIPSLTVIEDRPYITGSNGFGDIKKTLKSGIYLFKKSPSVIDETYKLIGRELIHSALLLSDKSGFLPKEVSLSDDKKIKKSGVIRPESVYPLFSENTYYPDFDYFFLDTGERVSVFNQADNFNIVTTSYGYNITFEFPVSETHSFAIRNIEPFYMLYLFGGRWSSDHRFQNYASGWWYDRQNNTLFVKIKHKSRKETIRIYKNTP